MKIKRKTIVILMIMSALSFLAGCKAPKESETFETTQNTSGADAGGLKDEELEISVSEDEEEAMIVVDVAGAVVHPGVYSVPEGSRVCDAIEAAGGISKDGVSANINQARLLADGEQIIVPDSSSAEASENTSDGKINLNRADKETLMTIPGIGEAKAEAIIAYREEHGSFQSVESLMEIPGIKEGIYNRISQYVCVN